LRKCIFLEKAKCLLKSEPDKFDCLVCIASSFREAFRLNHGALMSVNVPYAKMGVFADAYLCFTDADKRFEMFCKKFAPKFIEKKSFFSEGRYLV